MEFTLQTYPANPEVEQYQGTIDEIVQQVSSRLQQLSKEAPEGKQTIVLHTIPDITISNIVMV